MILETGHVIDPKNQISAIRDVAIKHGRIAAVAENIDAAKGKRVVNVSGLYLSRA
jgi:dihydroorotase